MNEFNHINLTAVDKRQIDKMTNIRIQIFHSGNFFPKEKKTTVVTKQSSCETGTFDPDGLMSHTLTQPFPPV